MPHLVPSCSASVALSFTLCRVDNVSKSLGFTVAYYLRCSRCRREFRRDTCHSSCVSTRESRVHRGFLTRLVSDGVCLTRLRACIVVVQRVSQGFLSRLVSDGEFLTRLDALEVVVQGVLRGFLTRLVSVGVFLTRLIAVEVVVQGFLRGFLTRLASEGGWGVQAPYDNSHLLV